MAIRHNADRGLYSRVAATGARSWYVRASVNGRMQHFGSFASKTAARQFYDRIKTRRREQRLQPGLVIPHEYTIPELFATYLPQAEYRAAYREQARFAAWWSVYWPKQRVFDLTPLHLEEARRALRTSGRLPQRSEGTVNHYQATTETITATQRTFHTNPITVNDSTCSGLRGDYEAHMVMFGLSYHFR
jgi:hypothetical protein